MAEAAANGFGKAEAPAKPVPPGPYTPGAGLDQEKRQLTSKLWELQKSGADAKAKWWSFCKVHAEGVTDPKGHDVAFLQTFFEAFEAGDIGIEEGCPFQQPKGKGPVGKDGGGKDAGGKDAGGKDFGGKAFGKDAGKGFGKDAGKGFGKDAGKGFGKDAGKGFGKDAGKGFGKGGGGGGGGSDDCKIFVGGVPKASTEEELSAHFSWYGTVKNCMYKYDDMGGFRGFAFVTFDSPEAAQKVLADAANQTFKGKWIDCKSANSGGGGGGGKGDKGGKGKSFDKGGKSFDKGGKSFDKGGKSFDKGGKSFDKGGKSFDKGGKGKSFDKGGKSFDKGGKSFDKGGKSGKGGGKW